VPNIIVITTDQQRADLTAREGFGVDTTPFADQIAGNGVWFDRAYTTSPLCCPARASLLTGRYPSAHRVRENPAVREAVFDDDLPGFLRERGYATALIGKNHSYLGASDVDHLRLYGHDGALHNDTTEQQRQFDQWLRELRHDTATEPTPFPPELQCPYRIVSDSTRWIDSVVDQPFFLWMSFPEPHNPYQVSEPYFSLFPPEDLPPTRYGPEVLQRLPFSWQYLRQLGEAGDPDYAASIPRARANYCGMLRLFDDQLRRFVGFLDDRGLRTRTLLVVTSDHGDYAGEYGLVRKGAEVPEVLTRVPLLINGPGVTGPSGPHPAHVSLADIFPTICDALGGELPEGVQGRSLWPMLTGQDYPVEEFTSAYVEQGMGGLPYEPDDVPQPLPGLGGPGDRFNFDELNAVTQSGDRRMVRSGDWKLVADKLGSTRLYHLPSDPYEVQDLSGDPNHAERHAELMRELATWMMRAQDPLPIPPNGYRRKNDPHNYLALYRP
jgi:arylsulfatase A-like enzyme